MKRLLIIILCLSVVLPCAYAASTNTIIVVVDYNSHTQICAYVILNNVSNQYSGILSNITAATDVNMGTKGLTNASEIGLSEGWFDVVNTTQLVFITTGYETNIIDADITN